MKKAFVRSLWGDVFEHFYHDNPKSKKIRREIKEALENPYTEPFVVYVFGNRDAGYLYDETKDYANKIDIRSISNAHTAYDMKTQMWRHKLDVFKAAMEDFDEVVVMDWDCKPIAPVPDDFWDVMHLRAPFQANLMLYRTKKCLWREEDLRKTCNGGFIYMRDKSIPDKIIQCYNELSEWAEKLREKRRKRGLDLRMRERALLFDDEPALSKYVDECLDGWKGMWTYWELFEPEFCNIKKSAFPREILNDKNACFKHWV